MEKDSIYWNDYTMFIKTSEKLTGLSPNELLEKYETLIEELENKSYMEWIYESLQEEYTVTIIHRLINSDLLKGNLLNEEFKIKTELLDGRFKKFLKNYNLTNNDWWMNFKEQNIIWDK